MKTKEDIIKEYGSNPDKWNWGYISSYQKLSEDFINEFQDKVNFLCLMRNSYCPLNIKAEYIRKNVTKENPLKHSIEVIEEKKDTSLDELKKLVGV